MNVDYRIHPQELALKSAGGGARNLTLTPHASRPEGCGTRRADIKFEVTLFQMRGVIRVPGSKRLGRVRIDKEE
jgi:hypothetical protein